MTAPDLNWIESHARQAGKILRDGFGGPLKVDKKGEIDLVTEMDHRTEAFLIGAIGRDFPSHQIISEEEGQLDGDPGHRWYIDPLDGTINYAHGIPIFTVSIGYAHNGKVTLGVVYDPMADECFMAERGRGSWLNGRELAVSSSQTLQESLLVTGFPYDVRTNTDNNLDHYAHFSLQSQGVRRLGSAALDLGYVAAGRFDGFWELRINSWDIAAGGLIVEEAGGKVTSIIGKADYLAPPHSVLAANPYVHPLMLRRFTRESIQGSP